MTIEEFGRQIKIKYPQYNDLSDLEVGQKTLIKYPQYQKDITTDVLSDLKRQKEMEEMKRKGEEAKAFLEKPWYKQLFTKQMAKELPGAVAKTVIETPTRFIKSLAEAPETIIRGGEEPVWTRKITEKIPYMGKLPTYQAEAKKRAEEIVAGEKPLYTALTPFVEVPLAAYETYLLGKGAWKLGKAGVKFITKTAKTKNLNDVLQAIAPKRTPKEIEGLAKQGRVVKEGPLGKVKIKPGTQDIEMTDDLIDLGIDLKKGDPVGNINRIDDAITENSQSLRTYVNTTPELVQKSDITNLKIGLGRIEKPIMLKSDTTLNNAYDLARQRALDMLDDLMKKPSAPTTTDIWDTRIAFDQMVKREFGDMIFDPDKAKPINEAVRRTRKVFNTYIEKKVGEKVFSNAMQKLNSLFSAEENIATQIPKEIGTTIISKWLGKIPGWIKGAAGGIIGGGAAGYGISRLFKGER